jgi:type IX secretion system PorP/SprF family membrane protein
MRKFLLTALLFCGIQALQAQEQQVYSQFFMNPYVYNPAYAGVEGHTAVFVMYRDQWTGLEGSPSIGHVAFHTPLKGGMSIGALAYNDKNAFFTTSGIKGTVGYLTAFDKKHYLRFGLSIGAGTTGLDQNGIDAIPNDPAFNSLLASSSFMIADFGISYHFDHFNVGFSIPNLISRDVVSENGFSDIRVSPLDQMLLKVNFRGHISHDFAIEPHIIYRYSNINASQYEAAVIFHLKHLVWVGGSYRQDAGAIGLLGFKLKEKIGVGYSYEIGSSQTGSLLGATHEVHIGFHIGSKKKHHKHSHSFIKSHSLSPAQRAKKEQAKLDALLNTRIEEPTENIEEIEETPVVEDTPIEEETDPVVEELDNTEDTSTEIDEDNVDIEPEIVEPDPIPVEETPSTSRNPNTVKRGNHFLELPHGNHVIVGAFGEFEHAETYSDQLFQRGYHDTIVGFVSAKGFYYVVVFRSDNYDTAEAQKDRIKTRPGLDKAWVLTVE